MVGIYSLSPRRGSRRLGLTKGGYPFQGHLLESALPQTPIEKRRQSTPDTNDSPQTSGDETPTVSEKDGSMSDNSEFGFIRRKRKSFESPLPERNAGPSSLKSECEGALKVNFHVKQSKISGNQNDLQASQSSAKANTVDDEDEIFGSMSSSQPKRLRKTYTYACGTGAGASFRNIHLPASEKSSKRDGKKTASLDEKDAEAAFRQPDSTGSIARANKLTLRDNGQPMFKKPPSNETTPRSSRASRRSLKDKRMSPELASKPEFKAVKRMSPRKRNGNDAAENVKPGFKAPKVVSSRKLPLEKEDSKPKFNVPAMPPEKSEGRRATRNSCFAREPLMSAKSNDLNVKEIQDALNTAKEKLGLLDVQMDVPASSTAESSLPSFSLDITTTSSPLSSPPLDSPGRINTGEINSAIKSADLSTHEKIQLPSCPLCNCPVDEMFLQEFASSNERMTIRKQAQFCKAHKKRDAEAEWHEKGYPKIDWVTFEERLEGYHSAIDAILCGERFSFYRNAFEDSIRSGKNRTLQQTLLSGTAFDGFLTGYYGSRGANVMMGNTMSRFASKIRRLAVSDKLISSGGVSGFVQAVLVPELAVMLAMDDMKVDGETAREILKDSIDIGNLLNEEEDETIRDLDEHERKSHEGI